MHLKMNRADAFNKSEDLEPEPSFEESTVERSKMRRQKSDPQNQEGQRLKILTPN